MSASASRNDALLNGALIAGGAIAIVDNIVSHWLLGLRRAVPGSAAGSAAGVVEVLLVALGVILVALAVRRETRARRRNSKEG